MKGINVLSLFDGMSCGQQALERVGIDVCNYFASEIDKYAIMVTQHNYPNTIQLGDVTKLDVSSLPKIDLLIGGSPCTNFSFAGKRKGMTTKTNEEIFTLERYLELKNDGYEFEGQSYLFWEYMRILNQVKPKYFLLENVLMSEKWEKILSKAIGVNPILINSSLVSAQNRQRLYWTNIGLAPSGLFGDLHSIIEQPKDKNILLKDILEDEVDKKYFVSTKLIDRINKTKNGEKCFNNDGKSLCLASVYYKQGMDNQFIVEQTNNKRLNETIEKHLNNLEAGTLIDSYNKQIHKDKSNTIIKTVASANNTHIVHSTMKRNGDPSKGGTGHLSRIDGKTYCLDTTQSFAVEILGGDFVRNNFRWRENGKSGTLLAQARQDGYGGQSLANITGNIRRLTPIECERLQTVKDGFTSIVSDTQRYKMLGNGWTIDVIAHIFNYLKL